MLQDPNSVIRISGTGYYDKVQREGEFYVSSQRHMLNNKVRRKFEEYQAAIDQSLNGRRERLLKMLQTEDRKNQELRRLELINERLLHCEETRKEAVLRRKERENKECGISDAKLSVLFAQSSVPYREYLIKKHAKAIAEDRKEIARYEEWDGLCQKREAELAEKRKPHFEEYVEQEEERIGKVRQRAFDEIRSSYNDFVKQLQRDQGEKILRCNEKRTSPKIILENQGIEEERELKNELLKTMKKDIDSVKKSREEEKQKEKLVEAFCNKVVATECGRTKVKKEALRDEQLRFMRYQKQTSVNEKAYDKYIDKLYKGMDIEKRLLERRQRMKYKEQQTMFMKEIDDFRKAVSLRKEEEKAAEQKSKAEIFQNLGEKLLHDNEIMSDKEKRRRERPTQYALDLSGQQDYDLFVHNQSKEMEFEKQKKAMTETENDYQELIKKAMLYTALKQNINPLRRTWTVRS